MSNSTEFETFQANGCVPDVEKNHMEALREIATNRSVVMSAEQFEKLYLSPHNKVKGELRQTYGNPTPMALIGFLLCLQPLSCTFMGWRGASNFAASIIPAYFFLGGLLMFVSGLLEWVLGNSFSSIVFSSVGCFWFTFGGILCPSFGTYGFYAKDGEPLQSGLADPGFNASLGFFLASFGLYALILLVCSLRTNAVFVLIFLTLVPAFSCLGAAFWYMAEDISGTTATVTTLFQAGGAILFVTCACGWYILLAIMLAIVDFPLQLPVGDLSTVIKGRSERV
ncbi:hypothetical protein SPBR_03108 [Sporothrix brasiliensis 5110]|uniref:Protein alcS n=1 Tax=Sporothrix brasiliensis 5110 TaxID=1398154 RepID=A0A0C2F087_9PEZI|nr:uncharacterized protein SPBR_03108 [Sporothrix brasiliensis 5110]KIH92204.1 hypothetical protein SPBR_03108 [Sporothrix brasiliensis 5110]